MDDTIQCVGKKLWLLSCETMHYGIPHGVNILMAHVSLIRKSLECFVGENLLNEKTIALLN